MYLVKNALKNITRSKGRNILIGSIIMIIMISCCVTLSIHKSGSTLVESYKENNKLEITFQLDPMSLRNASDEEKSNYEPLSVELINDIGSSSYVSSYYYTLEANMASNTITAVNYNEMSIGESEENNRPNKGNMGDFRLTSYSDFSFLEDFISGTKKITSGTMIDKDSTDLEIVISEDLREENNLELNDEITLYSPNDEDTTYTFKIVGIYQDNSNVEENSFMSMNAMNSRNQLYTNMTSLNKVLSSTTTETETTNTRAMMSKNGLSAKFYLTDNSLQEEFESSAREKGLSSFYTISTNEETVLETLKPIQNIKEYSMTFLIVILIVGAIILSVINMINIRERKYEIGVLRAIGMSKSKVTLQLILEIGIVSIASLLIGTCIGTLTAQPVTNMMLKSEINSYQEKVTAEEENFGGGNFRRPDQNKENPLNKITNNTSYLDSLTVSIDITTVLQLFMVSLLLTLLSGGVSVMLINQYEPNKILQNRT